jgi:hypothetical protein
MLFDLFHLFMVADKIGEVNSNSPTAADVVSVAPKAPLVDDMDVDRNPKNDNVVTVLRSEVEHLLETITDTADVFVSKFELPTITNFDQGKILDRVKEVAGTSVESNSVFLLQLKYSDELIMD